MPFCGNCGSQVPDGLKFCPNCGKPLVAALSPAQEPVQSVVQQSVPVQPVPQQVQQPVQKPVQNNVPPTSGQAKSKKNNMPLILGIAGGAVALILVIVGIGKAVGGAASAGDANSLSNMLYQAAYNRQYTGGGSSSGGATAKTGSPSEGGDTAAAASGGIAIADYASVSGSTYETDVFSVLVPDGWTALPVKDMWNEGAMDQKKVNLVKGGTSDDDLWSKNSIKIEVADNASYSVYTDAFSSYEEVELKLGDYTYTGPAGEYSGGWECAMLSAVNGEGYVAGSVFYKVNDEVISLSDADVQAILASIKVK